MHMKKLCLLLALLLLLTGCGKEVNVPQTTLPSETIAQQETESGKHELVVLDIFAVNDLHGKFADSDTQPGVDELSTYLKNAQQTGNTILLATGDMWQGSSESNLTGGLIITEWMNEMDFAAMAVGGHEFDWGEEQLIKNQEMAEFPFLAINIYNRTTNSRVDYCQSSVVVDVDGVQVGIIGAVGDCYNSISAEYSKNFYFLTGSDLSELVKAESEKLRSEGADFIILAIHEGFDQNSATLTAMPVSDAELRSYYDVTLSDGYVDLVFEADSHFMYAMQDGHGVCHLQAGGNNSGISHASVLFNKTNGDIVVFTAELIPAKNYSSMEDDPIVEQLMEKYSEQIAPANRVLGTNNRYRSKADICQLVADLYCAKGMEKWGSQYDIVLGGGFISCRSPGYLPAGEVTYSQIQALEPFDNQITLCSIKGRDLINKFLETDHYAYYIKTTAYGDSIRKSIDPNATYYVVTDTYSAHYAPNRMTVIDTYAEDIFARDLIAEYIEQGGMQN